MNKETEQIFLTTSSENQLPAMSQNSALLGNTQHNLENVADFSSVCRTCATVTEFVIPIFEGEGLQNNLADKIHKHLPIQVSERDTLPRVVCYQCASTLLAWHELVECCAQADQALRSRLDKGLPAVDEDVKSVVIREQKDMWKACRRTDPRSWPLIADARPLAREGDSGSPDIFHHEGSYTKIGDDVSSGDSGRTGDEDDEPLSCIATKKSSDLYEKFYSALVNFKNHFLAEDASQKCNYPDFTESDASEAPFEDDEETRRSNVDSFDDLTQSNMRKDKMDEATRAELDSVLIKINGKALYGCRVCGKRLSSVHTYVFHRRIHTGERPCVCHVCGRQFRAPQGLQRHVSETHERRRRRACRACPRTFANAQNLKQHMRTHTGERPFVCAHCGKRFTQSGSLHVHLKTHTDHFPFQCAECGAKFRLRSGLARHRLKHTGERPHACPLCGAGFRQRHELTAHVAAHSDDKPHACDLCGAAFRLRRALRHHARRVHEAAAARDAPDLVQALGYHPAPQY